ncbi:hypothetical protein [Asaia bogorensis]|uniref:hypothetical protein n=1 Tax=Asaia bogorensis TaxID=91915 RepID=UPI0030161989
MAFSGFDTNALQPTPLRTANPLEMAGQAAQIKNALLDYNVRKSEYDAQKAQGAAYADHYNPLTGKYDMPAVLSQMGASEDGQFGLPDAITRVRSQQSQQIGNDAQQLQLSQRRAGMIAGIAAPYLQKPDLTKTDLAPAYGTAIAHGLMSLEQANQSYASLPAGGDALKQQVRGLMDSSIGPEHAYQDAYGTTQLVDDGGVLRWQNVSSPASGQGGRDIGAPITKQTSPDFNNHLVPVTNSDGSPGYDTQGNIAGTTKPTVPLSVMGDGSYPGAANGTGVRGRAAPYVAGPPAGQVEAQRAAAEVTGREAGEQFGDAGKLSAGFGDRMYRSQKALQLMQEVSPASGKVGDLKNRIINAAVSLGMVAPSDNTAAYDLANKYLTQLAASQPGAAHSDAQLATALAGNPSVHINNLAAQDAIRAGIALDRRANAAYLAFHQKYPGSEAQIHASEWPAFQSDYTTNRDARAFMFDVMSPEQRARMWGGMSQKDRAAFRKELQIAEMTHLVQAPN